MKGLPIFLLTFLLPTFIQAQEGIDPIPPRELYGEAFKDAETKVPECSQEEINSSKQFIKCWRSSVYHKDYGCRYHQGLRPMCHCCGAYYHYIEHGPICTKFCLNEDSELNGPDYGQDRIIITLPFNWGWDVPDKITLEDGTELPVKCDSLDGKNYGCHDGENRGYRQTSTDEPSLVRDFILSTKNINTKRTTLRSTTTLKLQSIIQTTRATPKQRPTTRRRTTTSSASKNKRVPLSFGHELGKLDKKLTAMKTTNLFFKEQTSYQPEIIWAQKNERKREPKENTMVERLPVWD